MKSGQEKHEHCPTHHNRTRHPEHANRLVSMEALFRPAIERLLGGWIHSLGKEQLRFEGGFSTPVTLELADLRVREDTLHHTLALPAVTPPSGASL